MKTLLVLASMGAVLFCYLAAPAAGRDDAAPIRIGIIGLDTSHCVAFTRLLNDPKAAGDLAGFRVVAAYPGGSPDIAVSKNRVEGFTSQMREKYHVEIVATIDELLGKVDVVMVESVDGRPHLEQVRPVIKAGKRVFIDKPVAARLADVLRIFRLASESKVPLFSSSALRFSPGTAGAKKNPKVGQVLGCLAYSPCPTEEHHPDLFWYGVHGVEALYTIMGPGCKSVTRAHTRDADVVTGTWTDGRIATYRGSRAGKQEYGALVFGSAGVVEAGGFGGYEPIVAAVCRFFRTGEPPVTARETIEMFAFMEAADESKRQDGAPVRIDAVLEKAHAEADGAGVK